MKPLVSVIMPVYNVEKYLKASLDSILNQTYSNIELIAINDGSTDCSGKILYEYKKKGLIASFRILEQHNQGLSVTRNIGISKSQGKYIYFFDSDDLLDSEAISKLVEFSEMNDLDVIRFNAKAFFDDDFIKKNFSTPEYISKNLISHTIYSRDEFIQLQETIPSSVCIYFYKSSLLKDNDIYFYPNILHEDELFTPTVLLKSKKIGYIDSHYFKRRYREGSIMTSKVKKRNNKHAVGYFTVVDQLVNINKSIHGNVTIHNYLSKLINRLGSMIFLSSGLGIKQNLKLVLFGINPFKAIYKKLKIVLKNKFKFYSTNGTSK